MQEASDYVEHEILHERFHVTQFAGCAVLFNKDTFYPDISVKSIYLHDTRRCEQDHIVEGEHGWSGQKVFTVLSLHINNVFAKKRGIAKNIIQTVRALLICQNIDSVAGDFNGAAWRCRSRVNISTIDEVFSDCAVPTPNNWADVCGFPGLSGKLVSMVLSLYLDKLSVYVPVTKAAIMRRGFICTSLIGTISGIIKLTTKGTFASRNGQRALEIELKNVTSVNY